MRNEILVPVLYDFIFKYEYVKRRLKKIRKRMAQYYSDKTEVLSKKRRIHYSSNYEEIFEEGSENYVEK